MGSHERNRRRRIIAAILTATISLPLNQVRGWEPVRVDGRFDTVSPKSASSPTASSPTASSPTASSPTAFNSTAFNSTAFSPTASNASATGLPVPVTLPDAASFASIEGQSAPQDLQLTKVIPVYSDGSPSFSGALTASESSGGPFWAPVYSSSMMENLQTAAQIEAPLSSLFSPRWPATFSMFSHFGDSADELEGMIVDENPRMTAVYSESRQASRSPEVFQASQVHVAAIPSSLGTAGQPAGKVPTYAKHLIQPVRIEDHLAEEDRLEMLFGKGLAASRDTSPSATIPQPPNPLTATLVSSALIQDSLKNRSAEPQVASSTAAAENRSYSIGPTDPDAVFQKTTITRIDAFELALQRNPNLRVLARSPQIADTGITIEDAFFDPYLKAGVIGAKQDQQLTDTLQSFGGNFNTNQRDGLLPLRGINNLGIGQQLRGGGEYEVGVGTAYENFDRVGDFRLINPAWQSAVNLHFEQPLLAGRGRAIGESLIEIARINARQTGEEFRAEVNIILRDAEQAYWTLALLEQQSKAYDNVLKQSKLQVQAEIDRLDLGESILPDVLESKDQYAELQSQAAITETQRRNAVQTLANLLGYTPEQAASLKTSDGETPQVYLPSLDQALARLALRPELLAQRSAIRRSEVELRRQINALQPDLRMIIDYSVTGLGGNLADSMETVVDNDFTYAALGFVLQQPIGRRAAFAQVRRANLTLCQARQQFEALQFQYSHQLQGLYAQLQAQAEVVELAKQRVDIAREQYSLRLELRNQGEGDINSVLRTQQRLSLAQVFINDALYSYQQLLVRWQFEQGAIGDGRVAFAP